MGPPRPVEVNWYSRTHLVFVFFLVAVSSALAKSATVSNKVLFLNSMWISSNAKCNVELDSVEKSEKKL
jgi:hypothetical protein